MNIRYLLNRGHHPHHERGQGRLREGAPDDEDDRRAEREDGRLLRQRLREGADDDRRAEREDGQRLLRQRLREGADDDRRGEREDGQRLLRQCHLSLPGAVEMAENLGYLGKK